MNMNNSTKPALPLPPQSDGGFRIMLVGTAGAGKDTMARLIEKHAPGAQSFAFADEVKIYSARTANYALRILGLGYFQFPDNDIETINKYRDTFRPLWQWFGTDLVRAINENHWIDQLAWRIVWESRSNKIIVTDCRFPNEYEWGKESDFFIVKVTGKWRHEHRVPDHKSERHIAELVPDVEYVNAGTSDDMSDWVKNFLIPAAMAKRKDP